MNNRSKSIERRFNSIAGKKAFCNLIKGSEKMMLSRGKDEEAHADAAEAIRDFLRATTTVPLEEREKVVTIFSDALLTCWTD